MVRFPFAFALLLALPLAACAAVENEGETDVDEDGLSFDFEAIIGTDPDSADSDGDGFSDAEEYLTHYKPNDADDLPYAGEYPRGPLPVGDAWDALSEDAGWREGDFTKNWTLVDQWGQEVRLKRFYGQVVLINLSAEWCPPCRAAAETLDEEYTSRRDDGFVVLQLLTEGQNYFTNPEADRWIDDFDLTLPILADPIWIEETDERGIELTTAARRYVPSGEWGIPNYTILDRNHEIVDWYQAGGTANFELIDDLIAEDAPEVDYPMPENAADLAAELGIELDSRVHPFGDRSAE